MNIRKLPRIGAKVEMQRPLQGRIVSGEVHDLIFGGETVYILVDFGPEEWMELCILNQRGEMEISTNGRHVRVLE